ncbi:MAG: hypothetical protein M5U34_05510 [Chloroflexi bacterium]|nr:hypothetical protein [Chloroflexota bacterium]
MMEAIALRGGRIRPRVAAIKVLASSITLGAGAAPAGKGRLYRLVRR